MFKYFPYKTLTARKASMIDKETQHYAQIAANVIAAEALSLSNMFKTLRDKFEPIRDYLHSVEINPLHARAVDIRLTKDEIKLCNALNPNNFVRTSKIDVGVMPGITSTLLELSPTITEILDHLKSFKPQVLDGYAAYLALIISDKNARLKGKDEAFHYEDLAKNREELQAKVSSHFGDGTQTGKATVGDLIARAGDLPHALAAVKEAHNQFSKIDFHAINGVVKRCVGMLDTIIASAKSGQYDDVNSTTVNTLAAGAMEIARQVEMVGALGAVVMSYVAAGDNLVKALEKARHTGAF
jgi:hypothetical protein